MITLIDGRTVDFDHITFDRSTYHFTLTGGEDITNLIRRKDKIDFWPDFDEYVDNTRLSNERTGGTGPVADLPTSTTGILVGQLVNDPLAAPLETLNRVVGQVFTNKGVLILLAVGALFVVGVVLVRKKG